MVAIIAEALAVEVLPPDHPAKARLIGIVKQVQVKIKTLFFSAQDRNSTYMLQGNAGVFEACVNALSEPQKLAIRTVLA